MTGLKEISGVGREVAKELERAGFDTAEQIAASDEQVLQDVKGIGPSRSEDIFEAAQEVADEEQKPSKVILVNHYNPDLNEYEPQVEYYCTECNAGPFNEPAPRDAHKDISH